MTEAIGNLVVDCVREVHEEDVNFSHFPPFENVHGPAAYTKNTNVILLLAQVYIYIYPNIH